MRTRSLIRALGVCGAVAAVAGCATSAVVEQELTKSNTQTVLAFEETVFNKHEVQLGFEHYVGPIFQQHDPRLPDGSQLPNGKAAAIKAYSNLVTKVFPNSRMVVQRTLAQDDLVATQALWQSMPGQGHSVARVDIYRLENGRIVEHWDVTQDAPGRLTR